MLTFDRVTSGKADRIGIVIDHLVIAGWAGRDEAAIRHHIDELAAIGVPRPSSVPVYYSISADNLTQTDRLVVLGSDSSGEVEPVAAVPECGQRRQEPHRRAAVGDVEVGGGEQQAVVERGQQAGAAARESPVVLAGGLEELRHRDTTRPASRSESSSTSGTGARQVNTPQGTPSTTGVSGPHMPRT